MPNKYIDLSLPEGFSNQVRLFPLPNTVLFPGVVQALHIFEPRYQKMTEDSLSGDQLITMALTQLELVEKPNGDPQIAKVVCISKILSSNKMDDGNFNLFIIGVKRATIIEEFELDLPYRTARVRVHNEDLSQEAGSSYLREEILTTFEELGQLNSAWNVSAMKQFKDASLPLARVVDMICYASGIDPDGQQRVLETFDLGRRCQLVLDLLQQRLNLTKQMQDSGPKFPPDFSMN
jgi:ATP-dependent Lon protease